MIADLNDVTLVATPVTYSQWTAKGREDRTESELQARLFGNALPCKATLITCNVYGEPFVCCGRLESAVVLPRAAGGQSPWELSLGLVPPRKRNADYFRRDFPVEPVILMDGYHEVALDNLPPETAPLRWRCTNYTAMWAEVARRCHAVGDVWIDTTKSAQMTKLAAA